MFKYQTEKYILNSYILLFHDSSSIFNGILQKKIIHLKSNIMGSHANRRAEFYMKKIKFVRHDIEKKLLISKKLL